MWSEITSPICTGGFGRTASLQDACLASFTSGLQQRIALVGAAELVKSSLLEPLVSRHFPRQAGKMRFAAGEQPLITIDWQLDA